MDKSIADLRKNYSLQGLAESDLDPNPFVQFRNWFELARRSDISEPNAMTLATSTADGRPSARIVLLKAFDERGFVFFTNYRSQKGQEIAENPQVSLVFWWPILERQVRIYGHIEKVTEQESDAYFYSRPLASRLGAWVSHQSQVIPNRDVLDAKYTELEAQYQNQEISRPTHWGGLRVIPLEIEFWQGRTSRLHDRLLYKYISDRNWQIQRLSP